MVDLNHLPGMYYVTGKYDTQQKLERTFRVMAGREVEEVYRTVTACWRDGCEIVGIITPDGTTNRV